MVAARICLAAFLSIWIGALCAADVVVAVPMSLQPYFLPYEGSGLAYDTIRAAFAARGRGVRPLYVSSRNFAGLVSQNSRADCLPMIPSGFKKPGWFHVRSIRLFHDFAITRPGVRLDRIEDLRTKRVLASRGTAVSLGQTFRAMMNANPNYRELGSHRAQVMLLLQGHVEVVIADRLLIAWYLDYLREDGGADIEVVFHNLFEPMAHDFICRRADIAADFSAGLSVIANSGQLAAIMRRYGLEYNEATLGPPPDLAGRSEPADLGAKAPVSTDSCPSC